MNIFISFQECKVVFGEGLGSVKTSQEQQSNEAINILNPHQSSIHWNSGQTSKSNIYCILNTPCIVKEVKLAIRCSKWVTIKGGSSEEDESVLLMDRTETGVRDDATYNESKCVKTYEIMNSTIVSVVKLELETGGNISLFWATIKGQPRINMK